MSCTLTQALAVGFRSMQRRILVGALPLIAIALWLAPFAGDAASARHATAGSVYVMCFGSEQPAAKMHPAQCPIFGEPEDEAHLIRLANAHWTDWGEPTARATATALANKPAEAKSVQVTITLSSLHRRCGGKWFYTRLDVTKTSGVSDWFNADNRRTLTLSGACHEIPVRG